MFLVSVYSIYLRNAIPQYLCYTGLMKRSYSKLLPFEERILKALGDREMYGLEIAHALALERPDHNYSTLYRALRRMASPKMNLLTERMESPRVAERANRPRRRFYRRRRPTPEEAQP